MIAMNLRYVEPDPCADEDTDTGRHTLQHSLAFGGLINMVMFFFVLAIVMVFVVSAYCGPTTHEKEFLARQRQIEANPQMRFMLERVGAK